MAFDFEAGMADLMGEIGRLKAEAERNPQDFWSGGGYGPRRIANAIERLSDLAQRLHRHYRRTAFNDS